MSNQWEKPSKVTKEVQIPSISMKEMSSLDPENGESDLASVVYLSVKMMHPEGFFTKETLIDFLANSGSKEEARNPDYRERAEKTVKNFLSKGYLIENSSSGLIAKFEVKT